jgi:hypothetical protein
MVFWNAWRFASTSPFSPSRRRLRSPLVKVSCNTTVMTSSVTWVLAFVCPRPVDFAQQAHHGRWRYPQTAGRPRSEAWAPDESGPFSPLSWTGPRER